MATTYKQAVQRASAPDFQARVRVTLARVAGDIVGEAIGIMPASALAKRHAHGVSVLHGIDRDEMVKRYSYAVVMEPALLNVNDAGAAPVTGDEVTDAQLLTNVRALFPKFAGVMSTDV
jgi:hypothetical protein